MDHHFTFSNAYCFLFVGCGFEVSILTFLKAAVFLAIMVHELHFLRKFIFFRHISHADCVELQYDDKR
jgi:hypothetical protein